MLWPGLQILLEPSHIRVLIKKRRLAQYLLVDSFPYKYMSCLWSLMGGGSKKVALPKICHTYPKMMKLGKVVPYLKKIQKYIN